MNRRVLGVDPGRSKAGYALLEDDGSVLTRGIVAVGGLLERAAAVLTTHPADAIALGRGTNAADVGRRLEPLGLPIEMVDEYETTRQARALYFDDHPPRGWRRLVPLGLQSPPVPVDDYAAILIARRWLSRNAPGRGQS